MAIKINGTTVINDSRQLQNVASIDTATKNAMTAGGVGGLTTLVAEDAAFGTGAIVKLSLGNYTQQTFWISNIKASNAANALLRLSNSSDATITDSDYMNQVYIENSGYLYKNENVTKIQWTGENTPTATQSRVMDARITVWNAYSSSIRTSIETQVSYTYPVGGDYNQAIYKVLTCNMLDAERNQSLVFSLLSSNTYVSGPTTYTSIGVN